MGITSQERALRFFKHFDAAGERPSEVVVEGRTIRIIMNNLADTKKDEEIGLNIAWGKT